MPQRSFGRCATDTPEDILVGRGLFYITEGHRLVLDCTAGHYQMTWGYHHPLVTAAVREAMDCGIVWDDHSNIPGDTVKRLSQRLVETANGRLRVTPASSGDGEAMNTVLLGVCTGSVAASSACAATSGARSRTTGCAR